MKKLITSALPYVNNVPHLGNIIGCVLSADVYARFCRARGYETLYICGNDEYGTATENKAREEGLTPREVCDKYNAIHEEIYRHFNISFDYFGRTSDPEQTEVAQSIFNDLDQNGLIAQQSSQRTFCEVDDMFLADRFVEGTCPKCNYDDARGDQCDSCGRLLDPESLINPRCKICQNPPKRKETTHLYLKLDQLQERLATWFEKSSTEGKWTHNAIKTTEGWLERGLEPRPITRDLKWGIPVPKPGFENKVFYVWFDAPIGYISITAKLLPNNWKDWWQNPEEVDLYQFMAKDNIPFHTVIFPASLIGSGRNWTLLHHINSTEYLNYENTKFSKSRNIGVFGTDVKATGIHADLWRFYLLMVRPENSDSAFSWSEFFERVNSDFTNNVGNLVNRSLTYLYKNFDGVMKDLPHTPEQQEFVTACNQDLAEITASLEAVKLRDALRQILVLSNRGNKFFQDSAPWALIKEDPDKAQAMVSICVYLVRTLAVTLEPYMPETAGDILGMLNLENQSWDQAGKFSGLNGHKIAQPAIIHGKLDPKQAEKLRIKFSGDAPNFGRFQMKVGQIVEVGEHPTNPRNYLLKVDVGEATPRSIVAGLVKHYPTDQLQNRKVMVLANLKPAEIQNVISQGMVLAVEKRKKTELLDAQAFEVGQIAQVDDQKVDHGELEIDTFKQAPFKIVEGKVMFDEDQPVRIGDVVLGPPELQSGKLK